MADLIDRQAAINAVGLTTWAGSRISKLPIIDTENLIAKHEDIGYEKGYRDGYAEALEVTVDAVPVVRCKDCKWYEIAQLKHDGTEDKRYTPSVCVRGTFAKLRKEDWYCADGERREDGQQGKKDS